jgi:endonuclease YncB( thermonuclease family)
MSTATVQELSAGIARELGMGKPAILKHREIKQACRAYKKYAKANKAKEAAEASKKTAAMAVFEKLLGVKSEDEVRAMSPEEMKSVARRRIRQGLVTLEPGTISLTDLLEKVIQKSKSERRPSWKDCFIAVHGESKATEIQEATAETFSYRFVDSGL